MVLLFKRKTQPYNILFVLSFEDHDYQILPETINSFSAFHNNNLYTLKK